jgi:hypothetical protein
MIDDNYCMRWEQFARDKLGFDVYVVQIPAKYEISRFIGGFYTDFAGAVRDDLIPGYRWRGPAPVVCVRSPTVLGESLESVICHELAHAACDFTSSIGPEPSASELLTMGDGIGEGHAAACADKWLNRDPSDVPPWMPDHGTDFVRAAIHTWKRAWDAGWQPPLDEVWGLCSYELPAAWKYKWPLRHEIESKAAMPLRSVLATASPLEFVQLSIDEENRWRAAREPAAVA